MIELSSQGFGCVSTYRYVRASSEGFSCLFSIVVVEEMKCAVAQCHYSVLREMRK